VGGGEWVFMGEGRVGVVGKGVEREGGRGKGGGGDK